MTRKQPLCHLSAVALRAEIGAGQVSATEVVTAHLAQIETWNPQVNAIVTLDAECALAQAARADQAQASGAPLGLLHGLPIAHKDSFLTAGMRTTYGSPVYRDFIPERDSLIVTRERAAGAITLGKTNLPEFGALVATRRPRSPTEPTIWAAHFAIVEGEVVADPQYETDRARFLEAGQTGRIAHGVRHGRALSNTTGTVLDAIFSLRQRVRVAPGGVARIAFCCRKCGTAMNPEV